MNLRIYESTNLRRILFLATLFQILIFLYSYIPSSAYANVIEHWDGPTIQKIQENFGNNAWVVAVGSPDNELFAQVINAYSFNWVIRGHAHWLPIGQEMFENPESAAQKWNQFFQKLNKKVYFQPWNEPTSIDPECQGESLKKCVPKIVHFINALDTSKIKLATPAFDPHNQENTAAELIKLMKENGLDFNKFQVITMNVYNPDLAKTYHQNLTAWDFPNPNLPIVFTESGLLSYNAYDICQNMYCAGVIEQWQSDPQVIGWAIFSEYRGWNLWNNECVIDALKGDCHCETCKTGGKKGVASLVRQFFNRQEPSAPSWKDGKFGLGLSAGPSTPNNGPSFLEKLLGAFGFFAKFPVSQSHYAPSDHNGAFPGDDSRTNYYFAKKAIEFPGTTAEICLPNRDAIHKFVFFSQYHPDKLVEQLLNLTSQHQKVARSPNLKFIRDWITGSAFGDNEEFIDIRRDGSEKLIERGLTKRKAGYYTKYLSGTKREKVSNKQLEKLLLAGDPTNPNSPQSKGELAAFDKPLERVCSGGGVLTEDKFKSKLVDGRKNRTQAEKCTDTPVEVKPSALACCNPDFSESRELDYEKVCQSIPKDWFCYNDQNGKPTEPRISGDLLYTFYPQSRFIFNSAISNADLPVYAEYCYQVDKDWAKSQPELQNGFFIDFSPETRYKVFPIATSDDPQPRNDFVTKAEEKYWSCQITKVYLPEIEGAMDACQIMLSTYLPGEMYKKITEEDLPEKKIFPCDVGNLPNAHGLVTNKDTADARGIGEMAGEERWATFVTKNEVGTDNCPTGSSGQSYQETYIDPQTGQEVTRTVEVPKRCTKKAEIESHVRLYIPFYERFTRCNKGLKAILNGKDREALDNELVEANGGKLGPDDLLEKGVTNGEGWYSGLDKPGSIVKHYQENPSSVRGRTDVGRGPFYLPGGSTEISAKAAQNYLLPGSWQNSL